MNEFGNRNKETNLDILLSQCSEFLNEESSLQLNFRKLGCDVTHTPKYHCELVGEGIEYFWGNAKMQFRGFKPSEKGTKAQFLEKVHF